ncbi:integrase [Streptomyces mirabilis]
MIVSLVYRVTMKLLSVPVLLLRRQVAKDAELLVLRHENAVLRRQLAGPVRYEPADRLWCAALSSLIPRRRWAQVFPVTPGTVLAWHRRFVARRWDFSKRRSEHPLRLYSGPYRPPRHFGPPALRRDHLRHAAQLEVLQDLVGVRVQ